MAARRAALAAAAPPPPGLPALPALPAAPARDDDRPDPTLAAAEKRRRRDKSYLNRVTFLGRSIGLRATVQPGVHGYRHHATAAPTRKPSAIRDWVTSDLNRSVSFG